MSKLESGTSAVVHVLQELEGSEGEDLVPLDAHNDEVVQMLGRLEILKALATAMHKAYKDACVGWIEHNGKDLDAGAGIRFYAGVEKKTVCVNIGDCCEAILKAGGGEMTAIYRCLSSSAVKHGEAKKVLEPKVWDKHFLVEEKPVLKEGKIKKQLIKVDERFTKPQS